MSEAIASLSLDLDNKWTYMKIHGDPGWEEFPSYLDRVVPRFLDLLDGFGLRITVFVVGQDAALEKNHDALRRIVAAGHEIGNHSFCHEPRLHLRGEEAIRADLLDAETHIRAACDRTPCGFRGPGYAVSEETVRVLAQCGYQYDASTLPTYLGPLARLYYFATSGLSREERKSRDVLFGRLRDGFRTLRPHPWETSEGPILEIPVTTAPIFKAPIHFSYLLYLAKFSPTAAAAYFRSALTLCRLFRVEPSLLLHPLDFLGCDDEPDLAFFPAMDLPSEKKIRLVRDAIATLARGRSILPMEEHAARARERLGMSKSSPRDSEANVPAEDACQARE